MKFRGDRFAPELSNTFRIKASFNGNKFLLNAECKVLFEITIFLLFQVPAPRDDVQLAQAGENLPSWERG